MTLEKYTNLKYKFGNRAFWTTGYYVSTVALNEVNIKKYISEQEYEIAPGTLYGVLKNLEKQKLIEVVGVDLDNRKKKIYAITDVGKQVLQ